MINKIQIKNFKSIVDLEMDLGRVNIIIGANGCGKTNILEAISFASAASQDKLDNEFLFNRGIRVASPEFMSPAFDEMEEGADIIESRIYDDKESLAKSILVTYSNKTKKWVNFTELSESQVLQGFFDVLKDRKDNPEYIKELINQKVSSIKDHNPYLYKQIKDSLTSKPDLDSFLVYSPTEFNLRESSMQSPITPLGIKGNGLLPYLKELTSDEGNRSLIEAINEGLYLLDWFDGFSIPEDLLSNEHKLTIGDRFLKQSLRYFDQRSTNEGFLYLLFYLTLFNSKETPSFFAVDNIEASFNPKLSTKLINCLVEIAKKNNKQVILTTHSPYVLDGLDLSDDEQRLFVARRDIDGHTRIERIPHNEKSNMLLSNLWMSGLIGGLPDNF